MPEPHPEQLPLPIWIVLPKNMESPPPNEPCDEPRHALGFASTEKLTAFLYSRNAGNWVIDRVIVKDALLLLVADLHRLGVHMICFEPNPDGSGGTAFSLVDVMKQSAA